MNNFTIVWKANKIIEQWDKYLIPHNRSNYNKVCWAKIILKNNLITIKE